MNSDVMSWYLFEQPKQCGEFSCFGCGEPGCESGQLLKGRVKEQNENCYVFTCPELQVVSSGIRLGYITGPKVLVKRLELHLQVTNVLINSFLPFLFQ